MATWRTRPWGLKPAEAQPLQKGSVQEAYAAESECFLATLSGFNVYMLFRDIELCSLPEAHVPSSPPARPVDLFLKIRHLPFQVPVLREGELKGHEARSCTLGVQGLGLIGFRV